MAYSDLLKDPRWQRKRLEIFQRDNFTCKKCSDQLSTLHVHHKYYNYDLMPWEYPDTALITVCDLCHEKLHFMEWVVKYGILTLKQLGFELEDIFEVQDIVFEKVGSNNHKESSRRYMDDIKRLMHG